MNETHFDEYTYECLARNQHNLENTQKIILLQIRNNLKCKFVIVCINDCFCLLETPISPHFVDVTETEADDDTSVVWRIEDFEKSSSDSPVLKYRIKYVPEENVNTTDWDEITVVDFVKSREMY